MDFNVILDYFDKLNDEKSMFIEFENGNRILVDNSDIIRGNGDLIEIKVNMGTYITDVKNVTALKICNMEYLMRELMFNNITDNKGDK